MFAELLNNDDLLTEAYRAILDTHARDYVMKPDTLWLEYLYRWTAERNVRMLDLADDYAARFFALLSDPDVFEAVLDRLHEVDQDYEKLIVSSEGPEDEADTARYAALGLLAILFRRVEDRGEVQMLGVDEVAAWLVRHALALGGKDGQLAMPSLHDVPSIRRTTLPKKRDELGGASAVPAFAQLGLF